MFSRIDRYIVRQVLYGTLFAILVLCVVLVLGNIFKEIRPFLVEKGMALSFIWKFIAYLLPFTLVLIIPWSFLASVLLVFGRLSADQEITAMRSSGLSLYRIAAPVLILGCVLSGICLWLNGTQAPHSKWKLKQMVFTEGLKDPMRFFDPGVVQARLPGQRIYIEERTGEQSLKGLHAYDLVKNDEGLEVPVSYFYARDVDFKINREEERFDLRLNTAYVEYFMPDGSVQRAYAEKAEPWLLPYNQKQVRRIKPDQLDNQQIRDLLRDPKPYLESGQIKEKKLPDFSFERIKRYSFSFAPLALAFIAIPLGMQSRRKESSSGFGWTVFIAFAYFILLALAEEFHDSNVFVSQFAVWFPNLLCLALGLVLFRKASLKS